MELSSIKKEIMHLYKNLLSEYLLKNNSLNKENLSSIIMECIKETALDEKDYNIIKESLLKSSLSNKSYLQNEINEIIKLLSNKLNNFTLEYPYQEDDQTIYFHLNNNKSYLINYDSVEKKWYISLISTDSLTLISEIYSNTYNNFILFLELFIN